MNIDAFLTQLILDLEDVKEDINYDLSRDSVPFSKVESIIKNVIVFQENKCSNSQNC
jgi:hypothetical protein